MSVERDASLDDAAVLYGAGVLATGVTTIASVVLVLSGKDVTYGFVAVVYTLATLLALPVLTWRVKRSRRP